MIPFDLEKRKITIDELTKLTETENFWKDQNKSKKIISEINTNKKLIEKYNSLFSSLSSLSEALMKDLIANGAIITDFVPREFNQAIMFTGDDMGSDQLMIQWLLYIVVVVLAFIFAVTIRSTIEQESSAIGTLRASGYTKAEMFIHYLTLPMIVMLTAALVGNILGYTVMKNFVKSIYYNSHSLPTFETVWSTEAFVKTTIIPCVIIIAINVVVLLKALSLSPLQLLRREFSKKKNKKK